MMDALRRVGAAGLCLLTALALCLPALASEEKEAQATILFTHDTHSHFLLGDDGEGAYGGYTRLYTLLEEQRAAAKGACITVDGGDFSMGTLFQTIYTSAAAELRMLGFMGYDVTTLGNHEFDYRGQGLADMLNAAKDAEEVGRAVSSSAQPEARADYEAFYGPLTVALPAIVQANYRVPRNTQGSLSGTDYDVQTALDRYGVSDYIMIEKEGVRFAVFGLMGEDADACAPMSGMELEPVADAAKRVVSYIQANEDYDYIICLSHSGTSNGKGEDYALAKAVDGIDIMISGHTHSTLQQPIQVNDTLIVSCGEYTQNLGVLKVSRQDGKVVLEEYTLLPVTETVQENEEMREIADQFKAIVEADYLSAFGYTFDQVLADTSFDFTPISQFGKTQREDGLGNLIADSYIHAVEAAEGDSYVPVDFAVVASGVIRGSFAAGPITVSDAFNVSSLGSGADGTPGYPLISVYLTGRELKDAFEVDASVTPLMPAAQLYGAGMSWSYNNNRMIFNKVTQSHQILPDGSTASIVDDNLYRVVTGLYSGQMLGSVNAKSFGLLSITPKTADGAEVTDFEAQIIHNPDGTEVKEWTALASYLEELDHVPERYASAEGRKVVSDSLDPVALLEHPNWITLAALAVVLLLVLAVVLMIWHITHRRNARRTKGYHSYRGK